METIRASLLLLLAAAIMSLPAMARAPPTAWFQCPDNVSMQPAVIKGKNFYHSETGEFIPIRGMVYYPRPNDGPLSFTHSVDFFTEEYQHIWEPDIANFVKLGINAIRIYAVDPSQWHHSFMCALQKAGIYVMIGLLADCEGCNIGPNEAPSCYPPSLKTRGQYIINTFSKYNNTLVFDAGNEVGIYSPNMNITFNAPCQKQFVRDMRSYISSCSANSLSILPRPVPIGVVTADFERSRNALYYGCRSDPTDDLENVEWYGMNTYLHCDGSATSWTQLSGYQGLRNDLVNFNLPMPVVLAEFGCRERNFPKLGDFEAQRTWLQVEAFYQPQYQQVLAGAFVYEYSSEKRTVDTAAQNQPFPYYGFMKIQYGLGYFLPEDCNHQDIPCIYHPYPEFDLLAAKYQALQAQYAEGNTEMTPMYRADQLSDPATQVFPTCPDGIAAIGSFEWASDAEPDLPCYLMATWPPTMEPSSLPTMQPSTAPSTAPTKSPTTTIKSPTGAASGIASGGSRSTRHHSLLLLSGMLFLLGMFV